MLILGFFWLIKRTVTLHFTDSLAFLKGKLGCFEEDMWDDEEEEFLVRRNDRVQVPLHGASVEDLYKPPPPPSALVSKAGLSGNTMGNFDPDVDYSDALNAVTSTSSLIASPSSQTKSLPSRNPPSYGSIGSGESFQPETPPSRSPFIQFSTPSAESPVKTLSPGTNAASVPSASKGSARTSSGGLSGNTFGNYDPNVDYSATLARIALDIDDDEPNNETSVEKKQKRSSVAKLFKRK